MRPILYAGAGRFEIVCHESPATRYPAETHPTVQICVPMAGARYRVERETETGTPVREDLTARDILLVPREQPHAIDWQRQAGIVSLHVEASFVEELLDRSRLVLSDLFSVRDPYASASALELYAAMKAGDDIDPLFAESLAVIITYRVASGAARRLGSAPRRHQTLTASQLRRIQRHIANHLDRPIGLEELAQLIGVSRWHFLRQFQETAGTSPHAYVTQQRLDRAVDLLRATDRSIVAIAAEVGLTHGHFSRLFQRHYGTTPSRFRRDRRSS